MEEILEEERLLSGWPRRLLHVPTLTSYEWQIGNVYGGVTSPEYNALSYTWGRWKLRHEQPHVKAIDIRGTAWEIPRINEQHFTADEFRNVIRQITSLEPYSGVGQKDMVSKVDFVWLDVACIDQRGSLQSSAEIGRQAAIFKGAKTVYVWLTTQNTIGGQNSLEALDAFRNNFEESPEEELELLVQEVEGLLSDPWFSSLWTLQEAFLRQDGFLLAKSGELLFQRLSPTLIINPDLLGTFDAGLLLCQACAGKRSHLLRPNVFAKAFELVEKRGLNALAAQNAVAVYGATVHRTSTLPEDRVYGIQQIFGFRLGKSALGKDLGRHLSLEALEDQLGVEMMTKFPIISQFHIFGRHVPKEKRWRINDSSIVPSWMNDHGVSVWEPAEEDEPCCQFRVDYSTHPPHCVYFEGKMVSLARLLEGREKVKKEELFGSIGTIPDMIRVVTDVAEELEGSPEESGADHHLFAKGKRQYHLTDWLIKKFPKSKLQVLLLGPSSGPSSMSFLGLMLLKDGKESWTRIGVCQWEVTYLQISTVVSSQRDFFSGLGSGWITTRGIFGQLSIAH